MPDREPDDHRSSDPAARVAELVAAIAEPDARVAADAAALQDRLTKPRGALGRLETLGIRLCVISGTVPPPVPAKAAVAVFAGDHGVLDEGVSPWPQEVTAQMVANLCAGGAAINVLARQAGAEVIVVDVGVAGPVLDHPGLRRRRVRSGTANLAQGPAMTVTEARSAILVGAEVAADQTPERERQPYAEVNEAAGNKDCERANRENQRKQRLEGVGLGRRQRAEPVGRIGVEEADARLHSATVEANGPEHRIGCRPRGAV